MIEARKFLAAAVIIAIPPIHAAENEDIVRRLEKLAEIAPEVVNNSAAVISAPSEIISDWFRRKIRVKSLGYDVRRTDSLVSPFVGEIEVDCRATVTRGSSQQALMTAPEGNEVNFGLCKITYAFQGQKWVRKSGQCKSSSYPNRPPELMDHPDKGFGYYCAQLMPQE